MSFFSGVMPLFCQGSIPATLNGNLYLTSHASTASGQFSSFHLYAYGDNLVSGSMPLWVGVVADGPFIASMPFYAQGRSYSLDAGLNLYVHNSGTSSVLGLYASGQGWNPGGSPFSASMPLYLDRNDGQSMTLYCCAANPSGAEINVYAEGIIEVTETMNLIVPSSVGLFASRTNLYAGGF